ncbi:MAG: HDOD domain-containing protein [Fibrobacterota bacterium]
MAGVLFVDDDLQVLHTYRRMFGGSTSWDSYFAADGAEAMEYLDSCAIDIVITDLEMPFIDGVRLLSWVEQHHPDVTRVILSGYTPVSVSPEMFSTAHRFFRKPAAKEAITHFINTTLFLYGSIYQGQARAALNSIHTLPAFPSVLSELDHLFRDGEPAVKHVAALISRDPGLSATILKLVNSDYFPIPHDISSVQQAVALLGLDVIRGLVLVTHLFDSMPQKIIDDFNIAYFMRHSALTSAFCRAIGGCEGWTPAEIEFITSAGLFLDVGELIFALNYSDIFKEIADHIAQYGGEMARMEERNIGMGHGEAGAYVLGLWGLPDDLISLIAVHHRPERIRDNPCPGPGQLTFAAVLHCADLWACEFLHGEQPGRCDALNESFISQSGFASRLVQWKDVCRSTAKTMGPA